MYCFMYCFIYVSNALTLLQPKVGSAEQSVYISLQDGPTEYLSGHVINGRNLFPATGYLVSFMKLYHPKRDTVSL
jgi:hypothetical protein